jgi:hypothetical protein
MIVVTQPRTTILLGVPTNTTIECDEEITDAVVFGLDNCDDFVDVSLSATTQPLWLPVHPHLDRC